MNLTKNFSFGEFACKCGCGTVGVNTKLLKILQSFREFINNPVIITSGFRCKEHNINIGGAKNSYHLQGLAIDFYTPNLTVANVYKYLRSLPEAKIMGIGAYYSKNFVHIDFRGNRVRWTVVNGVWKFE